MTINSESIANITREAYSSLKSKALGGVSKESAQNAISEAVNKAVRLGEEAVGKVQQEMQSLRNKTAREIADMTSQKDSFVNQVRKNAEQEISRTKQEAASAIKKANATKSSERILPNGHKSVRSVNKNGAVMVKEYNEAGQLLKSNVTTLDGSIRRTSYNPVTGKPIKTITNTSGKDVMIEYKEYGQNKITQVNNKKVKPQKPTLVSQSQPKYVKTDFSGERGTQIERIYSDGTKEQITRITRDNDSKLERVMMEKYDKDGQRVADKTIFDDAKSFREHIYLKGENKTIAKETIYQNDNKIELYNEKIYDESSNRYVISKAKKKDNNSTTTYKAIKDEFGFYTGKYTAKTTYPKGSGQPPRIFEVQPSDIPHIY